jgi:hypothetical protein
MISFNLVCLNLMFTRTNAKRVSRNAAIVASHAVWVLDQKTQDIVDLRVARTHAARSDYVRSGLRPFQNSGSMKAADSLRIQTEAGLYWFHETLPKQQQKVWNDMLILQRDLLSTTCDYNDETAEEALQQMKLRVIRGLVVWARYVPETEHAIIIHEIVHICDCVYKWNSPRNYWAFMSERFVGWLTNFIHNRHHIELGMLLGYSCSRVSGSMPPARLNSMRARHLERFGVQGSHAAMMLTVDKHLVQKKTTAGSGRRNTVALEHATLTFEHATLKFENATLKFENATLEFEHATLEFVRSTLEFGNATLKFEHATLKFMLTIFVASFSPRHSFHR